MKIVLCTGGFDPLHGGHIAYLNQAKELGDKLIVGLNSDAWLVRKKGQAFMPLADRLIIVNNLNMVDSTILFDDSDDSAVDAIQRVKNQFPDDTIIFANGGDRDATSVPEVTVPDVIFKFGVGGNNKLNSSSQLLKDWKTPTIERSWGCYRVLHEVPGMKVKELTINPGEKLSMQRHNLRNEFWIVSKGQAILNSMMPGGYALPSLKLKEHASYTVPKNEWHQLSNPFDEPCMIVEIQHGTSCDESDIERKD